MAFPFLFCSQPTAKLENFNTGVSLLLACSLKLGLVSFLAPAINTLTIGLHRKIKYWNWFHSESHCQDATRNMNRRKDEHMIKEFRRWRELAFPLWYLQPLEALGPSPTTVFRKLASMLADKWNVNYSHCLFWLRCRLCFPFSNLVWCA